MSKGKPIPKQERKELMVMYVEQSMSKTEIADLSGRSRTTIDKLSKEDDWDVEKKLYEKRNSKLLEAVSWLQNRSESEKDLKIAELAKDQLVLTLTSLQQLSLESPENAVMMSGPLQKTLTSLEKLVNASVKSETKGAKQVDVNVQKVDWTEVMRMVIEAKKQGIELTKEEAFKALKAAQGEINGT